MTYFNVVINKSNKQNNIKTTAKTDYKQLHFNHQQE